MHLVHVCFFYEIFTAKRTPRGETGDQTDRPVHVEPMYVPGLHPTPRAITTHSMVEHEPYVTDRVITPTKYRAPPSLPFTEPASPLRDFGVQTGMWSIALLNIQLHESM